MTNFDIQQKDFSDPFRAEEKFEVEREHDGYDELRDRSYNCYAKETVPKKGTKGGEKGE